jgi:hypothetical protein
MYCYTITKKQADTMLTHLTHIQEIRNVNPDWWLAIVTEDFMVLLVLSVQVSGLIKQSSIIDTETEYANSVLLIEH